MEGKEGVERKRLQRNIFAVVILYNGFIAQLWKDLFERQDLGKQDL